MDGLRNVSEIENKRKKVVRRGRVLERRDGGIHGERVK